MIENRSNVLGFKSSTMLPPHASSVAVERAFPSCARGNHADTRVTARTQSDGLR